MANTKLELREEDEVSSWSYDARFEPTENVDLPSIDDYEDFDLISAYDFEYWRRNPWGYIDKAYLCETDFKRIVSKALDLRDEETYSCNPDAANSSALELAIWSMDDAAYQSKIHPNVFKEMLVAMEDPKFKKVSKELQARDLNKLYAVEKLLKLAQELKDLSFEEIS